MRASQPQRSRPSCGCRTHDLTQDARLAALVLLEDVDEIAARVAMLDDHVTPMVFLSAGAVDEAMAGPELAGIIVTRLAERLLAIRPDLELYHLDYRAEDPPAFWGFTAYEDHPRWHRVTFESLVTGELSPDRIHLRTVGYVERLMSLIVRSPQIVCRGIWE